MQNQITIFNFENSTVRTAVNANNEPYFCLADVADILAIKNSSDVANKQLDKKGCVKIEIIDSLNRKQQATFINEPNLYRVIFRSNKTEAEKFQNWVFEEVLPSIRKTGNYSQKTNAHQRQALVTACDKLAVGNTLRSDIYKMVGNQFGVDDIQSIPMHQLADATAFVYEILLAKSAQPNHNAHSEHNAFWRTVGILEYDRISREIRELDDMLATISSRFHQLNKTKGLLFDSLSEQKISPHNHKETHSQAVEFINRQMALKAIFY